MKNFILLVVLWMVSTSLVAPVGTSNPIDIEKTQQSLSQIPSKNLPSLVVLEKALTGFSILKSRGEIKKNVLSIADFSLSSNKPRLWIIDLDSAKVRHHSLVAHGKNTGNEFAHNFSNIEGSHKSSLGFYVTGSTYQGKHGLSLYLNGMEKNFNDKARNRAIVMHGAKYVSDSFIKQHGRLGRSFGCPSLPMKNHKEIINSIKEGSCLFIYSGDKKYLSSSTYLN